MQTSLVLSRGLTHVDRLNQKLQELDKLLLTGTPDAVMAAASAVEMALNEAGPDFSAIANVVHELGTNTLTAVATQLRRIEEEDSAALAESLRNALANFSRRAMNANRRASQLNRSLGAVLKSLQSVGIQESGRLIAEA